MLIASQRLYHIDSIDYGKDILQILLNKQVIQLKHDTIQKRYTYDALLWQDIVLQSMLPPFKKDSNIQKRFAIIYITIQKRYTYYHANTTIQKRFAIIYITIIQQCF